MYWDGEGWSILDGGLRGCFLVCFTLCVANIYIRIPPNIMIREEKFE